MMKKLLDILTLYNKQTFNLFFNKRILTKKLNYLGY